MKTVQYKLLKNLPDLKKGAIFTRVCKEEVNKSINLPSYMCYTYQHVDNHRRMCMTYTAPTVESSPKWFKKIK